MTDLIYPKHCAVTDGSAEASYAPPVTTPEILLPLSRKYCLAGRSPQSGVGLIEVLIAVLVLSIGFLGIAALLAKSLATNNSAMARSMATIASYSILDVMRADLANARSNAYDGTVKGNSCPAATPASGTGTLATAQLNAWCKQLADKLGASASTTGTIKCTGSNGDCTITIQFDDSRAGDSGKADQTVVTRAIL
ncbi:MAG: type IV pilus modification protein PilV [Dyella sp.]|uniref:type IV pilus modification protein PilV n=1 Tax=Dyella sp. TaxID=1869338 RepID=UPI003F7D5045